MQSIYRMHLYTSSTVLMRYFVQIVCYFLISFIAKALPIFIKRPLKANWEIPFTDSIRCLTGNYGLEVDIMNARGDR